MVGGVHGDAQMVMVVKKEGHVTGAVTLSSVALSHAQSKPTPMRLTHSDCDQFVCLDLSVN